VAPDSRRREWGNRTRSVRRLSESPQRGFPRSHALSWVVDLEIGFGRLLAASLSVGVLALLFGALALAAGLAVSAWIFDGLAQAVDALEPWRPLTPYYHALGQNPLREGTPWAGWAILTAATAVFVVCAGVGLERRDVRQ
jgi:ABC-2 type transport system permease protein